jgi:ATP-dependent exoDNAse (exonuclease V) alpha subunit
MQLTSEQREAVLRYSTSRFLLINGGPGVGKTTVIKHIAAVDPHTLIMAPTGCAANRIVLATEKEAHVIKKVLFDPALIDRFYGASIIIDEGSMVSMEEFTKVLRVLKPRRLCIVADAKQLPCVENTPFLPALLATPQLPRVVLTVNHRQQGSALLTNIENMRVQPVIELIMDDTFKLIVTGSDQYSIEEGIKRYGQEVDAQMLAFTNATVNALLKGTEKLGCPKVVCTKNLYNKDKKMVVANGVTGCFVDDRTIAYENGFQDEMRSKRFKSSFEASRAMTVNKAQGNEFKATGIVVATAWGGPSFPRELIYTACSRFKQKMVLITSHDMLNKLLTSKFGSGSEEINAEFTETFEQVWNRRQART